MCVFRSWMRTSAAILALGLIVAGGCGSGDDDPAEKDAAATDTQGPDDDSKYRAHEKGPHGGWIIVFEGDPYRVELVLDSASGKTTVYILDDDDKLDEPITSSGNVVTLNLYVSGKNIMNYKTLRAVDATGTRLYASQFELTDQELIEHLSTSKENAARLYIPINGSPRLGWVYGGQD